MSRTVKTTRVRCDYCGSLIKRSAVKQCRDGTYRCPSDAAIQSVRGRAIFRTRKIAAIYEARHPSRGRKSISKEAP